jgi:hypothetical protein
VCLTVQKGKSLEDLKGSLPATREYPGREAERRAARKYATRETLGGASFDRDFRKLDVEWREPG